MGQIEIIGYMNKKIIDNFQLNFEENQKIYLGDGNKSHMLNDHPDDFMKYGSKISEIIKNPDYVAKHPKKESVEFIKKFQKEDNPEKYVLVAVRASGNGVLYARTLFVMDDEKVDKYNSVNAFIEYKTL